MRKLSLFIIAASATLGVAVANADDAVDTGATTDPQEVVLTPVDEMPVTGTVDSSGSEDPVVTTDPVVEDPAPVDDTGASDETGSGDEVEVTDETPVKYDDTQIYTTTDSGPSRGTEGCMECRTLTGESGGSAAEAQTPEVMADVLDGNATGVDVMDPADAKKRK